MTEGSAGSRLAGRLISLAPDLLSDAGDIGSGAFGLFALGDRLAGRAGIEGQPEALGGGGAPVGTTRAGLAKQHLAAPAAELGFIREELDEAAAVGTGHHDTVQLAIRSLAWAFTIHGS